MANVGGKGLLIVKYTKYFYNFLFLWLALLFAVNCLLLKMYTDAKYRLPSEIKEYTGVPLCTLWTVILILYLRFVVSFQWGRQGDLLVHLALRECLHRRIYVSTSAKVSPMWTDHNNVYLARLPSKKQLRWQCSDKEAIVSLSRVHKYYFRCNPSLG